MRIGALLRRIDPELLDRWYLAAGTALHVDGRKPHRREVAEDLLSQLGLDPALVGEAIDDPSTNDEVRTDHDRLTGLGGWGVPTLVFAGDRPLFGPVLIEPPTGPAAVRLWRLLTGWLEFPALYEVQRPKSEQDLQAIALTFRPYLEARDWITIQKETP
jgi:DSBA-like thioredoxin domain